MFRKTSTSPQLDIFSSPSNLLGKRAAKKYEDPNAWHNMFFKLVTSNIDEETFSPLFKTGKMGAPNASVRILVAMSILKEGFGCSDEDLFEKCEFDMLTRKAIGLVNIEETPPSLDTYYLFRRRMCEYHAEHEVDLMEKCFESVTGEQIRLFKISGKSVRMDSKLIGSNIAQYSRYELIHRTLCKVLSNPVIMGMLSPKLRDGAQEFLGLDAGKIVYRADQAVISRRLSAIGMYIYQVLKRLKDDVPLYALLHRVFHEQYAVEKGKVSLRDKKAIASNSLQSPDDPDAAFRNKNGRKTHGYVTNITETVEEDKPSIITSVQTRPATFADCHFLQGAVAGTERVTNEKVEDLYADGAYQSPENRDFARNHDDMKLKTGRMQGGCRFILDREKGTDNLHVTDTRTGEIIKAAYVGQTKKHGKRWRIPLTDVKQTYPYRYFTEKEVDNSQMRKQIEDLPIEEQNKRNNVEATMFQYSFHTRNNKTRYRGLVKHQNHAHSRCMWMNLVRLVIFQVAICKRTLSSLSEELTGLFEAYFRHPNFSRTSFEHSIKECTILHFWVRINCLI